MRFLFCIPLLFWSTLLHSQINSTYNITFDNAVHHEAHIEVNFRNIKSDTATFRMSRTSPGRYALHEFAKNVYAVKVTDKNGNGLKTYRTDPYSWHVADHNGEINVSYTLFANHGDGTYSQIDETHAHLNMPATFMYMEELKEDEIEISFKTRTDLNWKIATQLKPLSDTTFYAKNLQYFMDSPTELSNHRIRSFEIDDGDKQTVEIVLHDMDATDKNFEDYTNHVENIVREQVAVYGELPDFDYGKYTFLACFMPQVDGDAMEHRNSTFLTSTRSIKDEGVLRNLGSAAHEFFHCWNVERIRPKSLEPFDFTEANMSGELWFAEGFTSYYTGLSMVRADVRTLEQYLNSLQGTLNYVWGSQGLNFHNPIEMSYQAPFVDAARSVDETNRENTFISYYSYGEVLGLALDLMLREQDLSLDGFMAFAWNKYGKDFKPYTIADLQTSLGEFSNKDFADFYFKNFIYDSKMPDYKYLFNRVGIDFIIKDELSLGTGISKGRLNRNPEIGSTAYIAGLQEGDRIMGVDGNKINSQKEFIDYIKSKKQDETINLIFERYGEEISREVKLKTDKKFYLSYADEDKLTDSQKTERANWLNGKRND